MKANELRIGNAIKNGIIISFYEHGVHVGYGKVFNFEYLEPIPLTEEILLKCGFEKKKTDKSITYTFKRFRFTFVKDGRFKDTKYLNYANAITFKDSWNCRYLHQLQNLYFALTEKELEINL